MNDNFFEIVCGQHVIGVCREKGVENAFKEDNVSYFGKITKAQFEKYGDDPWVIPKSKVKYNPKYVFCLGSPHC